jgi:hypothetical protein
MKRLNKNTEYLNGPRRKIMKTWLSKCLLLAVISMRLAGPANSGALQPDSTLADLGVCYATLGNGDPNAGALIKINLTTGVDSLVGPTGITGEWGDPGVPALAVKFSGEIYAMDIGSSANLYLLDASTGAATLVGPTGLSSPPAIAFDGVDRLYAIDSAGDLYKVDYTTGASRFVAATGVFIKGMAFDPQTGILWGCDASSDIYTIDQTTGSATFVGNTGQNPSPDVFFSDANELIASSGGGLSDNNLISIDQGTGAGTVVRSIGYRSVSGMGMRHDRLTPVAVQAYGARWVDGGVEITWRLVDVRGTLSFDVVRASGNDAVFEAVRDARVFRRGDEWVFVDHPGEPGCTYHYRVVVREDGTPMTSFQLSITTPAGRLALEQNHPNPFNPTTTIPFSIERDQRVLLEVHDVSGRIVATLVDRAMLSGEHSERWDGRDNAGIPVATGVYFVRLTVGTTTLTRKAVLAK